MKGTADYTVVYDISSDSERVRVDKVLKGFGFRAQKSVYECRLDKRGKRELIQKLGDLKIATGFVKIYRLEYSSKKQVIGVKKGIDPDDGHAFIV